MAIGPPGKFPNSFLILIICVFSFLIFVSLFSIFQFYSLSFFFFFWRSNFYFIDSLYCFSIFNFIEFCSIYYFLPSVYFGFVLLLFFYLFTMFRWRFRQLIWDLSSLLIYPFGQYGMILKSPLFCIKKVGQVYRPSHSFLIEYL